MTNPLHHLKKEAQHIRLSAHEKAHMRVRIAERIHASRRAQKAAQHRQVSHWSVFSLRYSMALTLVFVMLFGSTTTYAAQGSLPGDLLYPIKVYVNEGVAGALALSDEARVSFHTAVAQERLKEAEKLAHEGRLNAAASLEIEENFNTHVQKADIIATGLEEKDPAVGVEVRVALDSSLAAHGSILARIGEGSDDEETKENSSSIAQRVRSRGREEGAKAATLAAAAPSELQTQPAPPADELRASKTLPQDSSSKTISKSSSQKKVALQLQKKAAAQLEDTRDAFDDARSSLNASTTSKIEAQLPALQEQFDAGKKQAESGAYDSARAAFTEVLKGSVELRTLIEASKTYKRDLVHNKRGSEDDEEHDEREEDRSRGKGSSRSD